MDNKLEQQILDLRLQEYSLNKISIELGCSKSTVSKYCNLHGLGGDYFAKPKDHPTKEQLLDLIKENLNRDEIAIKLNRSSTQIKYLLKKYGIGIRDRNKYMCRSCNQKLTKGDFYGNGITLHTECKKCFNSRKTQIQQQTKLDAVAYLGGKCANCGYDRCIAALDFHHIDPNEKDRSYRKLMQIKFTPELQKELDKCVLLCATCHREAHHCPECLNDNLNLYRQQDSNLHFVG